QARLLLRLAGALADGGNEAYLAELLPVLALAHPELTSPLARHGGATLARVAPESQPSAPLPTPLRTFAADCRERARFEGKHIALGAVPRMPGEQAASPEEV